MNEPKKASKQHKTWALILAIFKSVEVVSVSGRTEEDELLAEFGVLVEEVAGKLEGTHPLVAFLTARIN